MSWNSGKPWLAILVLFLSAGSSLAQVPDDRRPKSILDYYFLLPHKHLAYLTPDSRSAREAAIQIKDVEGGFLKSGLTTDDVSTTLALFKTDADDVIAVENRSCLSGCSSSLKLLSYAGGQWADVTHDLLPAIDESKIQPLLQRQYMGPPIEPWRRSQLIYTLRKNGRSIEVNEHWSGMVLGEFEWANDAFVYKAEDAAGSNNRVLASTENPEGDRLQIIGVDPESPASLPLNGHLRIRVAYHLKSGKHGFIWATPVVLEQRLPDSFTSGSYPYKPGSGVTTVWFGFNNQAHLDLLRVTMVDDQRKPILTLTYPIDANWKGRRECPKFRVSCRPNTNSGAELSCMVYPSGVLPGQEFTYNWNVSTGSIVSGQGTRRIIVNLISTQAEPFKAEPFKAELEIGNLSPACERKTSFTAPIRRRQ